MSAGEPRRLCFDTESSYCLGAEVGEEGVPVAKFSVRVTQQVVRERADEIRHPAVVAVSPVLLNRTFLARAEE